MRLACCSYETSPQTAMAVSCDALMKEYNNKDTVVAKKSGKGREKERGWGGEEREKERKRKKKSERKRKRKMNGKKVERGKKGIGCADRLALSSAFLGRWSFSWTQLWLTLSSSFPLPPPSLSLSLYRFLHCAQVTHLFAFFLVTCFFLLPSGVIRRISLAPQRFVYFVSVLFILLSRFRLSVFLFARRICRARLSNLPLASLYFRLLRSYHSPAEILPKQLF